MADKFGFTYPLPEPVKLADLQMLAIEKHHLKRDHSEWGVLEGVEWKHLESKVDLAPLTAGRAEIMFRRRYRQLSPKAALAA